MGGQVCCFDHTGRCSSKSCDCSWCSEQLQTRSCIDPRCDGEDRGSKMLLHSRLLSDSFATDSDSHWSARIRQEQNFHNQPLGTISHASSSILRSDQEHTAIYRCV